MGSFWQRNCCGRLWWTSSCVWYWRGEQAWLRFLLFSFWMFCFLNHKHFCALLYTRFSFLIAIIVWLIEHNMATSPCVLISHNNSKHSLYFFVAIVQTDAYRTLLVILCHCNLSNVSAVPSPTANCGSTKRWVDPFRAHAGRDQREQGWCRGAGSSAPGCLIDSPCTGRLGNQCCAC